MISVTWRSLEDVRQVVRDTQQLTAKPFGVNLVLHWDPEERVDICLAEGVKIISFFWGDPAPYVDRIHQSGAVVMHTVGSAEEAKQAIDAGVDVIVTQGWEAGGHVRGTVGTMALVPAVVDAASPAPVVAAGGIADGRGIAAALMLGASGGWLGTRFLASEESEVHLVHKQMVVSHSERDTVYGDVFNVGWEDSPHRVLRNSTVKRWEAAGKPAANRPGADEIVAWYADGTPVPRYTGIMPETGMTGDLEGLACFGGQSAGLIRDVKPAGNIVAELVAEAVDALERAADLL